MHQTVEGLLATERKQPTTIPAKRYSATIQRYGWMDVQDGQILDAAEGRGDFGRHGCGRASHVHEMGRLAPARGQPTEVVFVFPEEQRQPSACRTSRVYRPRFRLRCMVQHTPRRRIRTLPP